MEESPVIRLPDNQEQVVLLRQKLAEYKERWARSCGVGESNRYQPPEETHYYYAVRILETLLQFGEVDTFKLSRAIAHEHGGQIARLDYFEHYCGVIEHYATHGVKLQ